MIAGRTTTSASAPEQGQIPWAYQVGHCHLQSPGGVVWCGVMMASYGFLVARYRLHMDRHNPVIMTMLLSNLSLSTSIAGRLLFATDLGNLATSTSSRLAPIRRLTSELHGNSDRDTPLSLFLDRETFHITGSRLWMTALAVSLMSSLVTLMPEARAGERCGFVPTAFPDSS